MSAALLFRDVLERIRREHNSLHGKRDDWRTHDGLDAPFCMLCGQKGSHAEDCPRDRLNAALATDDHEDSRLRRIADALDDECDCNRRPGKPLCYRCRVEDKVREVVAYMDEQECDW